MRFGDKYNYLEPRENDVLVYHETLKTIGDNSRWEDYVPYSEISSVRYVDSGGLIPTIGIYLMIKGKSFSGGFNPYGYAMKGREYRGDAKAIKEYIEAKMAMTPIGSNILNEKNIQNENRWSFQQKRQSIKRYTEMLDRDQISYDRFDEKMAEILFDSCYAYSDQNDENYLNMDDLYVYTCKGRLNYAANFSPRLWAYHPDLFDNELSPVQTARGICVGRSLYEEVLQAYGKCQEEGIREIDEFDVKTGFDVAYEKNTYYLKYETKPRNNKKYVIQFFFDDFGVLKLLEYYEEEMDELENWFATYFWKG